MPPKLNQIWWDRSRTASDDFCPADRYWGVEYGGIGLQPQGDNDSKYFLPLGSAIHKCVELLGKGVSAKESFEEAWSVLKPILESPWVTETTRLEHEYLLRGWVFAYERAILPEDLEEYDITSIEAEALPVVATPYGTGTVVSKPDWLLRRRSDGKRFYKEFKSTNDNSADWLISWTFAAQLLTGSLGCEFLTGESLHGSIIQGLYKGTRYQGETRSALCGVYCGPDGSRQERYKAGFSYVPFWKLEDDGGPEGQINWIHGMSLDGLKAQFPFTPPIMADAALRDKWVKQRMAREAVIAKVRSLDLVSEEVRDTVFPMHTGGCVNKWGDKCSKIGLCYNPQAQKNPFAHGYEWRQPHLSADPAHKILEVYHEEV